MERPQPITLPSHLGAALREYRKDGGLTQKQAGRNVGLLPKTISSLELDPGRCSVESLFKLLSALKLEVVIQPREQRTIRGLEW